MTALGCLFGHDWHLVGDWREGGFLWSGSDKRSWGFCSDFTHEYTGLGIRIECARCHKRNHATFRIMSKDAAWLAGRTEPPQWELVTRYPHYRPVKGGPTHDEVDREVCPWKYKVTP